MIDEQEALRIARERIGDYFDLKFLTPEIQKTSENWVVQFRRSPQTPGGEPQVIIDANTGEVVAVFSTQ